jgi:uncharacterized protein with HEPN domain
MKREYVDYVRDMIIGLDKARQFTQDLDYETFAANEEKTFAVVRAIEIIGEAARNIPDRLKPAASPRVHQPRQRQSTGAGSNAWG